MLSDLPDRTAHLCLHHSALLAALLGHVRKLLLETLNLPGNAFGNAVYLAAEMMEALLPRLAVRLGGLAPLFAELLELVLQGIGR